MAPASERVFDLGTPDCTRVVRRVPTEVMAKMFHGEKEEAAIGRRYEEWNGKEILGRSRNGDSHRRRRARCEVVVSLVVVWYGCASL